MIDELTQYKKDRPAWQKKASIKLAEKIPSMRESNLLMAWSLMTRGYQQAVWAHLNETQRLRIKALRCHT